MFFNNRLTRFPISNNKIVDFDSSNKCGTSPVNSQNFEKSNADNASTSTNKINNPNFADSNGNFNNSKNCDTPYVDFFAGSQKKEHVDKKTATKKQSAPTSVSVASYNSFLKNHNELSQRIEKSAKNRQDTNKE